MLPRQATAGSEGIGSPGTRGIDQQEVNPASSSVPDSRMSAYRLIPQELQTLYMSSLLPPLRELPIRSILRPQRAARCRPGSVEVVRERSRRVTRPASELRIRSTPVDLERQAHWSLFAREAPPPRAARR